MKMKKLITPIIASFLLAATNSFSANNLVLTDKSYGPVTFGGKLTTIEKQIGEKAKSELGDEGCDFVTLKKLPGIMFMVEDGTVTRAVTSCAYYGFC